MSKMIRKFSSNAVPIGGTGGRSSSSGVVATVFGATGTLGRYVVNQLGRIGSQVILPYRGNELSYRHMKVMGDLGQIVPLKYDIRNVESIERAVSHSSVVINLIGAQIPTQNFSLDDANYKIARLIARIAKESGNVKQLIHVSDIRAAEDSPSEYARLKFQAEKSVFELFPGATIVRPAPLFCPEDKLTNTYGILLRYWRNTIPLINGEYELQPIYAGDASQSILDLVFDAKRNFETAGKIVELVGPERFSHKELLEKISELTLLKDQYTTFNLPATVAEKICRYTDRLPRFRPHICREEVLMRMGRFAVSSQPNNSQIVRVEKGKESISNLGLLWLRRFREANSMNQVVGDTHRYDKFFIEEELNNDLKKLK